MRRQTRTKPRRAALAGAALACTVIVTSCGSSDGVAGGAKPADQPYFGPPSGATEVAAIGSADQVATLTFVTSGRRYLVRVGQDAMVRTSSDPARSSTYRQGDGTRVTATCAGSSESSLHPGVVEVAGPLTVSWANAGAVVSALSQDDTDACSPDQASAQPLVKVVQSLPRLDSDAWSNLVAEHPVDLSGGPDTASGSSG